MDMSFKVAPHSFPGEVSFVASHVALPAGVVYILHLLLLRSFMCTPSVFTHMLQNQNPGLQSSNIFKKSFRYSSEKNLSKSILKSTQIKLIHDKHFIQPSNCSEYSIPVW